MPFSTEDIENYFDNIDPDEELSELEADHWDYILYFSEYRSTPEGEYFSSHPYGVHNLSPAPHYFEVRDWMPSIPLPPKHIFFINDKYAHLFSFWN